MSQIQIDRDSLKSQSIRFDIGERIIDVFSSLSSREGESDGEGLIRRIAGGLLRPIRYLGRILAGFGIAVLRRARRWLLRNLWDIILSAAYEISYFDWNQSDDQIRAQMRANELQILAQLGELIGVGAVWMASIAIAGLATFKWPVISGAILLDLIEEGSDEIRAEVRSLLSSLANGLARNGILATMLLARRARVFGLEPIEESRQPWTISESISEKINSISGDRIRVIVENMIEAGIDSLIEVGYVVSYSIEDFYRASELAQRQILGEKRGAEIQFDERLDEEKIIVSGPQEIAQQSIENALTTHRLVYGRDIGQVVGMPLPDYQRAGIHRRKLTLVFKSKEKPPWVNAVGDEPVREYSYTIPEVHQGLTWRQIKQAAKPWTWGKSRCTANFENGRQMAIYAVTQDEAESKLRELAELSSLEILTISTSTEGDRHQNLRKEPIRIFPAYATLTVRKRTDTPNGVVDREGVRYSTETQRIELWPDSEPSHLDPIL